MASEKRPIPMSIVQHPNEGMAGKYLIFLLGDEEFGTSVLHVKEIMKMQEITQVPQSPTFVQGVINLRGKIVPVVNLRRRFKMVDRPDTQLTCIVVIRVPSDGVEQLVGVVVDGVVEVLTLNSEDIEETPDFGSDSVMPHVRGMAKVKGKVKILLEMGQILHREGLDDVITLRA